MIRRVGKQLSCVWNAVKSKLPITLQHQINRGVLIARKKPPAEISLSTLVRSAADTIGGMSQPDQLHHEPHPLT